MRGPLRLRFTSLFVLTFARLAAAGDRDGSFGVGGIAHSSVFGAFNFGNAVVIQPGGEIVGIGTAADAGFGLFVIDGRVALLRVLANGTLDASFGAGG